MHGIYILRKPNSGKELYVVFDTAEFNAMCKAEAAAVLHHSLYTSTVTTQEMHDFWIQLIKATAGDEVARQSMSAAVLFIYRNYKSWGTEKTKTTLGLFTGSTRVFVQAHADQAMAAVSGLAWYLRYWYSSDGGLQAE